MFGTCAALAGAVLLTAAFAAQDKGKDAKAKPASAPAAGAPAIDPEMMKKWEAFATPGPDHKVLDALVGKWTTQIKMWMDPAAPMMESTGTCEMQWVLGGRYLHEEDKGSFMGQPFEGMGVTGFDNLKKKYVASWIDNMGMGIMRSEGTYDAAKKTINYTSECPDPTMTKYVPSRMTLAFVDANTVKMEMFGPDKSGKEYKGMELTYTRAK
jgi:hypothetical protein